MALRASLPAQAQLLERTTELATLEGLLHHVTTTASGRLCLISGEAGIGKTALVRCFCSQHPSAGALWGACDALFTARPLGPFADIALASGGSFQQLLLGNSRPYEVAAAFLELLGSDAPRIAVLEDLHWADEATLDVLRLLSKRIESAPGLVLATYRDDGLSRDHPLRVLLGELPRDDSVTRIKLPPLSRDAVATLADSRSIDSEELYRKTAGNPFFVTEVLASVGEAIPSTVRDAVLARASRLSHRSRFLLDSVAIAPPQVDIRILEIVAAENFGGLGECVDGGMLVSNNCAVAFRNELARLAIEDSIAPDRELQLHRTMLRALETRFNGAADPARLAHHAERAHEPEALLRFGRKAGERASVLGAHREAVAQYGRALTVADSLQFAERAELLQLYAHECLHVAQVDRAIEAQEQAVELFRQAGDPARQGGGLRRLARLYSCGVRGSQVRQTIEQAVRILEGFEPSTDLAIATAMMAFGELDRGEAVLALELGRRALRAAEQSNDDEALIYVLNSLGTVELALGQAVGKARLLRSLDVADELGMDEHVGRAYLNLAGLGVEARSFDGLPELIRQGTDYCFQHGLELWRMWLLTSEARMNLDRGDLSRAAEVAQEVLNGERGQLPRVSALPVLALVRARRGDPEVWPLLDEARAMAERDGELGYAIPVAIARAEAAWLEGRPEDVGPETDAAFGRAVQRGLWWSLGDLTCWRRRAGIQDDVHPGLHDRYAAELRGEHVEAAAMWSALGCEYDAAVVLAASGDDDLRKQSLVKLHQLGARAAAAMVSRQLRAGGATGIARGPRATTRRNPAQLTSRELEVLTLIAYGMRNAEIAKRLFLSQKTVDHHVSAILRKLSVDTRAQASHEAGRLGLLR